MAKVKKRYTTPTKEIPKEKSKTKKTVALILALIAIGFLLINALYLLISREVIINKILESEALKEFEDIDFSSLLPSLITALAILWLIVAIVMSLITYFVEKGKWKWYVLLIISIISLLVGRIEVAIVGIISSFLYKN